MIQPPFAPKPAIERAREMAGLKVDECADQRFAVEAWA
jgi:hypothetical protein